MSESGSGADAVARLWQRFWKATSHWPTETEKATEAKQIIGDETHLDKNRLEAIDMQLVQVGYGERVEEKKEGEREKDVEDGTTPEHPDSFVALAGNYRGSKTSFWLFKYLFVISDRSSLKFWNGGQWGKDWSSNSKNTDPFINSAHEPTTQMQMNRRCGENWIEDFNEQMYRSKEAATMRRVEAAMSTWPTVDTYLM